MAAMSRRAMLMNILPGAAVAVAGVGAIGWAVAPDAADAMPLAISPREITSRSMTWWRRPGVVVNPRRRAVAVAGVGFAGGTGDVAAAAGGGSRRSSSCSFRHVRWFESPAGAGRAAARLLVADSRDAGPRPAILRAIFTARIPLHPARWSRISNDTPAAGH